MSILVVQFERDGAYTRRFAHNLVNVLGIAAQRPSVATSFLATVTRSGEIKAVSSKRFM